MSSEWLPKDFFRHEYGKMVATLTCRVGEQHLSDVEDAVQSALVKAVDRWPREGKPSEPSAWLFRVAQNHLMEELRRRSNRRRIVDQAHPLAAEVVNPSQHFFDHEVNDDVLRMLFACCPASIPDISKLTLALKVLCGFSVREIAIQLFSSEEGIYKRLHRAREVLKSDGGKILELSFEDLNERVGVVREILYLLFTEGYLSSHAEEAIRSELCDEAIRLTTILAEHPSGAFSETYALLALMHFHRSRLDARQSPEGQLLLLQEQDRSCWDKKHIQQGMGWMAKSAQGMYFSRYHGEAAIAAEHCTALSFEETRWENIVHFYELLESCSASPVHRLNRAVAMAESGRPTEGLVLLKEIKPEKWLAKSYLWNAVMADLNFQCGHKKEGDRYRDMALSMAPSDDIRTLMKRRFETEEGRNGFNE